VKNLQCAVLILAAAFAAPLWAAQSPAALARAFGAPPQSSYLTLSPGGGLLAWEQPGGSGAEVIIYDLRAHAVRRTLQIGAGLTVDWLGWEDDGTLLMSTLETERLSPVYITNWRGPAQLSRVIAVDIASGRSRVLLADRMTGESVTAWYFTTGVDLLAWDCPGRPHTAIMATAVFDEATYRRHTGTLIHRARRDSGMVSAVFAVDTRTGKDEPIAYGDPFTTGWVVNSHGDVVARMDWRPHQFTLYARQGEDWRQIYQHAGRHAPDILGVNQKSTAILGILRTQGRRHLWAIPLDGSPPRRMLPAVKRQVMSVELGRYAGEPTAVWVGSSDAHRIWLDDTAKMRYESLAHVFPGRRLSVYDPSRDGSEILVRVQGSGQPAVTYLVDFATHRADIAGEAYPQLAHVELGTTHTVRYRTRGGRAVRAEVIMPPGGGKSLPLVVLPPGGPEGNYPGYFDWFAQYLAALGYAVLRPDITTASLPTAGGPIDWGGASQSYAIAGVRLLVKQGVADPHRVCIAGVGYGGYAALAGAAFSPDTYACAVSVNGISDLPSLLGDEMHLFGGAHSIDTQLVGWRTHMGSPFDPKLVAESPVHAANAVVAPVLLIHDAEDTVVPLSQSQEMKTALQRAGKRVTFVKLAGSDHWLNRGRNRIEVLTAVGTFLHTYLH
jgi:dienelactone hydrolase